MTQGTLHLSRRNSSSGTSSPRSYHCATLGSPGQAQFFAKDASSTSLYLQCLILWPFLWHDADSGLDNETGKLGLYAALKPCTLDVPARWLHFQSGLGFFPTAQKDLGREGGGEQTKDERDFPWEKDSS